MVAATIKMSLPDVLISLSSERVGQFELMKHQLEVRDSTSKFIVQNVPTSGGKTLASLLNVLRNNENAIFVYPTNAILHDQVKSIKDLVERCGRSVRILGEQSDDSSDINILPISGELLDRMSSKRRGSVAHGRIIRDLMREAQDSQVLMLTNPDILFLIIKGEFKDPLRLFKEFILGNFGCIVLDEFHLYHGYSLANLFFLLSFLRKKISKVILSSATLADRKKNSVLSLMSELFGEPQIITPEFTISGEGRIIRHKTDLTIDPIPSKSSYLYHEEDMNRIVEAVDELYTRHEEDKSRVKVLVILNSVVFAEQVRKQLEEKFGTEKVTPIHGLVPKKARLEPSEFSDIVVGTSAIEVGVDFDGGRLIFKANNASSFIQRLGRGARHNQCETLAFIPIHVQKPLRDELRKHEGMSYEKLVTAVKESLEDLPAYEEFLRSEACQLLYLGLLYRFVNSFVISNKISKDNRYEWIKNSIKKGQFQPPFFNSEKLMDTFRNYGLRKELLQSLSHAGFRDFSMEIPVFFEKYKVIQSINVLDLQKLKFKVESLEAFRENLNETETLEPQRRREIDVTLHRFRLQHRDKIAVVTGLRAKPTRIQAGLSPSINHKLFVIDQKVTITVDKTGGVDSDFLKSMKQALMGIPGYYSYLKEDWRMPVIPCKNGGFLFIGAGAVVKYFLEEKS